MSRWGSPDAGSGRGRVATAQPNIWRNAGWALLQALALVALGYAAWRVVGSTTYRIDIDVYRMGGQAWLDGHPLYSPDVKFHTPIGLNLPFTYPPLAAVIFAPFAWLGMPAASVTITLITLALLLVSTMIVLTRMDVWETSRLVPGPAWLRRWWLTALIVAWATLYWEPIKANFAFGQINVVLMTLVIAECVPRRTPWPRGLLLGLGIVAQAHTGGVSAVLPAEPRPPGRSHLVGVGCGCARGRVRAGLAGLVGVLDSHRAQHRSDRLGEPEHQPEHRRHAGAAGPQRPRTIPALGGRLLPGARADGRGRRAGCCAPESRPWR